VQSRESMGWAAGPGRVKVLVVSTDEEHEIAQQTVATIKRAVTVTEGER